MSESTPKELKCIRYITGEMDQEDRPLFEVELMLDDELRDIYENYRTIWENYPEATLRFNKHSSGRKLRKKIRYGKNNFGSFFSRNRIITVGGGVMALLCLGLYLVTKRPPVYTNHRIAGQGQRLAVTLPDSTKVVINSGGEIRYPNTFEDSRDVWLRGEAFFEVKHDKTIPFVVHTDDMDVKVLGTQFNVNCGGHNTVVSLEKGKVNVLIKQSSDEIHLLPSEELVLDRKSGEVIKRNFDVQKVTAWKDNMLLLDDIPFGDAVHLIGRFYGVHFSVAPEIRQKRITGAFKDQDLDEFIRSLEFISDVTVVRDTQNNYTIIQTNEN
ncbi:FecR domain-containing protein [Sinomicrobium kalidii]|uniref:FecR family protein n=1 Tax=Sinomicrobium kalidii TaxID=2900738 RepID=UPI001E2F30E2|nr:FecR domain-containing protein [Sinomicrobium kalidii]UGU16499.1 FecR domain-containing protein [Sinomicrobium kalidii]